MLMKYLSEYQPSRMRSMSSLKTEAGRRRRSKMVMPTWIIASGDGVAGFGCDRPPAWCPAGRYGLLELPFGVSQVIVSPLPSASPFRPRLRAALLASLLAALAWPAAPLAAAERDPAALIDRLETAWKARDEAGWMGAWRPRSDEQRTDERDYVRERWAGEESRLEFERPSEILRSPFKVPATAISITEPRGRVEQADLHPRARTGGLGGHGPAGRLADRRARAPLAGPGLSRRRPRPPPPRFRHPLSAAGRCSCRPRRWARRSSCSSATRPCTSCPAPPPRRSNSGSSRAVRSCWRPCTPCSSASIPRTSTGCSPPPPS